MADNVFEKLTDEERGYLWMYMIFNRDKIIEKTEEWTKEAEKRGMTLTEYLESINPLDTNKNEVNEVLDMIRTEIENYDNFIICANGQKGIHIDAALDIIDKYKVRSEDEE